MRLSFLVPAIIGLAAASAAADAPFATHTSPPDYTVVMIEKSPGRKDGSRTVTHHGDWTRVDSSFGTEYFSTNGAAKIWVFGQRYISLTRDSERSPLIENVAINTGDRQTYLGESCSVWTKKYPGLSHLSDLTDLSCITDDGIELWHRSIIASDIIYSAEATRIERRPVTPDEVQPSRAFLTLDWWDQHEPATGTPAKPDYETVMELSGVSVNAGKSIRTTRRHGPWQSREEMAHGLPRFLQVVHDSGRPNFRYEANKSGAPKSLTMVWPDSMAADQATIESLPEPPKDLEQTETILGESCHWFDIMPGAADAGLSSCLTSDGIVLKEVVSGYPMRAQEWTAVRLTRRPIQLDEIKPPAWLLDPQLWGIN
jgi:hypothetical protein